MLAGASPRWKGTVPAGSLEEELEEAPRKAHERGQAASPALRRSTSAQPGTAGTAPLLRVQESFGSFPKADAMPFH